MNIVPQFVRAEQTAGEILSIENDCGAWYAEALQNEVQHHVSICEQLLDLIEQTRSRYHATANLKNRLTAEGYTALAEDAAWDVRPGGRYVVTRNDSSLLAFRVPEGGVTGFALAAAHSDSPTFQIKEHAEKLSARCTVLDTEKYGGMLMNTWFDRPLSVADGSSSSGTGSWRRGWRMSTGTS